ncbi:FMN-binding protein [Lutibacter maritimus]|uniref:Na+-translocating ferredoxin:NAD+ oxidoreductase RNF, RnfG subunit n=1 Tax=Lutibacter maritimus TaxID=593133 RepID=A0A1I6NY10_9FLAO|nr:FMN-binding protein [Lutibacter maritimus]SFS32765.1 Na+-translocating ferredoxin:NAD+ oxidoreductase RNF, RnfG subunit [Lutibacter maritimus]
MKKIIYITALVFLTSSFTVSKRIEALIAKEIKSIFSVETFQKKNISISNDISENLPQKITDTNFYKIYNNQKLLGYYYFGQAFGKADYFDFIVIFDKNLIVSKVKVLVYREDHGGEVGSKRWLNQFSGKSKADNLIYQKDIAAISGATISAKSMTNEINKLLKTVQILHQKQVL